MKIKEITLRENFTVTQNTQQGIKLKDINDPNSVEITIPPDKLAALKPHPGDPNKFSINPAVLGSTSNVSDPAAQQIGPKVGSNIDIPTTDIQTTETIEDDDLDDQDLMTSDSGEEQNKPVGGDATDKFISDVTDKEFERSVRGKVAESEDLIAMLTIAGLR